MTTATDSPEVRRYLDELRRLLGDAPDRDLVIDGVERHIADALGDGAVRPEEVRAVLDELGDPAAIAAEAGASARSEPTVASSVPSAFLDRRAGAVTVVLLLTVGGLVVPVVGWIAGLVLLWLSRGWTVLDKVVGTIGVPVISAVVLGTSALLGNLGAATIPLCTGTGFCPPSTPAWGFVAGAHAVLLATIPLAAILVGAYLLLRFRPGGRSRAQ